MYQETTDSEFHVGSFHLPEAEFTEFTKNSIVGPLEKAHQCAVAYPKKGLGNFGVSLLRAAHVLSGMRLHNGPLSDLSVSIGHDGKVFFPKDKIVSALHATRPGVLATILRYHFLEYFKLRQYVIVSLQSAKVERKASDGAVGGPDGTGVPMEDPESFFFTINDADEVLPIYRADIVAGMPIAIQERESELRSQLCRYLEAIGASQAVKDAILGHSTEMSTNFGEDRWWTLREFAELATEYLDRYAKYLGFPEVEIDEAVYEETLRKEILRSPKKQKKPIRKRPKESVITTEEFRSKVSDLQTMMGRETLDNEMLVGLAKGHAGNNLIMQGKLLRSVGSCLPKRDAARLNRQRSNLEHDHGLGIFVLQAALADFLSNLFKVITGSEIDDLDLYEIASLGEILFLTESGVLNAALARAGYKNALDNPLYIHKSTTVFFVFTGGRKVQAGRMTHQVMIDPAVEYLIETVRELTNDKNIPSSVISTKTYENRQRQWFSRAGFEDGLSLKKCFERLRRLLEAEAHYTVIPMLRGLYGGEVISTPLPIEDYYACAYTTRRAAPKNSIDSALILHQERSGFITLLASRVGSQVVSYRSFNTAVRKAISEADKRAKNGGAPKFRKELQVGVADYIASQAVEARFTLAHRIVLCFLWRVSEVGIRGTKKKKRVGVAASIDRFLTEILPVIFHVYSDCDEYPPGEDDLPELFRIALDARPDRAWAEPIIDLCLDYLEESDFLEHPGKNLIYSGERSVNLARSAYISKSCFLAFLALLEKEPDPFVRNRRILKSSILYRFGNRFSEVWWARSLNIEISPVGDCFSVIARGDFIPKSTAGNRWTMRFSELTEVEVKAYEWLQDLRQHGLKSEDFVFRPKDRKASWLEQQREQAYLGHVLRIVSGNPNRCLYDLRHTFAANLLLGLYVNVELTPQLAHLTDDRWHEHFSLPEELLVGGKRYMHAAEAFIDQMGHIDIRTIIHSYFPFAADLYQYYWSKRTVPRLTLGALKCFLKNALPGPDVSQDEGS